MSLHTLTWSLPGGARHEVHGSREAVLELWTVLAGAGAIELEIASPEDE